MVPGRPQTTPREAGEWGCIQNAYGEHRTSNIEQPTSSEQKPGKAAQSDLKATLKLCNIANSRG
jgi:hypothetical protein